MIVNLIYFKSILFSNSLLSCDIFILNFLFNSPKYWAFTKIIFVALSFFSPLIIFKCIFKFIFSYSSYSKSVNIPKSGLLIGLDVNNDKTYIPEASLYQNILVTGAIGSGKTSSALYPFLKQLIFYKCQDLSEKIGFLVLDVKGNFYKQVVYFSKMANRLDDVIIIELNGKYKYNPLDKPNLKSSVIANRLKSILLLFSPNNSESYWLDVAEQVLESCINICRAYNDFYVTFEELHKLVTDEEYYSSKLKNIREIFISGKFSSSEVYDLFSSISYLEKNYFSLDDRTKNILKSEITRITNCFISDFNVKNTFCPLKEEENFLGFSDVINYGKIVVLNMNIAEYRNLSKIIAAYLKLDFQTDVMQRLSRSENDSALRSVSFISDEYQEYVTANDADFYAQSRESKCINIVSTQSYTSLLNALNNTNSVKVIIQNLVNKIWFRSDDIFTIEDIQKQLGKEEKEKISKTFSENSKETNYNFFTHDFFAINSDLSESISTSSQFDFAYDYKFFTQELKSFECLAFLSDGIQILKPKKLQMIPYFKNIT